MSITDLPVEILMDIFSFVPLTELVKSVQNVCPLWNDVMHLPYIWNDVAFAPSSDATEREIIEFLKCVPQLRIFSMDVPNVSLNNIISSLCEMCTDIHSVYIESDKKTLQSHDLEMLVTCYPHLLAISFGVHGRELHRTVELLSRCSKLRTVLLKGWWWLDSDESIFRTLIDNCKHIKRIHFGAVKSGVYIASSDLSHLLRLRGDQLVSLNFTCKTLNSQVIELLGDCCNLQELHFGNLVNGTEINLRPLARLQNLRLFSIEGSIDEGGSLCELFLNVNWPRLEVLNISFLTLLKEVPMMQAVFKNCRNIKHLAVKDITADALQNIDSLQKLESLNLAGCRDMTDSGVKHVSKIKQLKILKLNECKPLTDVSLMYLAECKELRELELNHCWNIEGNTLYVIPQNMKQLTRLSIINDETINEEALLYLRKDMPQLKITTNF